MISEELLQITIITTFREFYPNLVIKASLNGISLVGLSVKQKGILIANAKKQGMLPGEADIEVLLPLGNTLHIEMKTLKGVQSDKQKEYEGRLGTLAHKYFLCNSSESFFKVVNDHLDLEYRQELFKAYNGDLPLELVKKQYELE